MICSSVNRLRFIGSSSFIHSKVENPSPQWPGSRGQGQHRLAADLFLLELELRDRHPDVGLAVYGMQHYGISPCELSHLAVEVFGSIDPGSEAASVRRKALRAEARGIFVALGYRIAATPGRDVFDISPAREPLSAHDRVARLAGFRARLGRAGA
jgi:hypothetical protein